MDPKALEQLKDFQTCLNVYDIIYTIHNVKPEWNTAILKHCMELTMPPQKTETLPPPKETPTK